MRGLHLQLINPARPKKPCGRTISTIAISAKIDDLGHLRRKQRGHADDDADQQAGQHGAADRSHAADHRDDKSFGEDGAAHLGDDALQRCRQQSGEARRCAVPIPNTISQTCATLTPSTRTICGSRAPARMIRPKLVFSRNSHSASSTTAVGADHEQPIEREIADADIDRALQDLRGIERNSRSCRRRCAPVRPSHSSGRTSAAADSRCRGRRAAGSGRARPARPNRPTASGTASRQIQKLPPSIRM